MKVTIEDRRASGKETIRMAQKGKRPYGSGCLVKRGNAWIIRWREEELLPDGTKRRLLRQESLGDVSRRKANDALNEKLTTAGRNIQRNRTTFSDLAGAWKRSILPMYKHSTRKAHADILEHKLIPVFGEMELEKLTSQEIQFFIAEMNSRGYAPHSTHHFHNVLSTILGTAVKWGHIKDNPASRVELPKLVTQSPRWVLSVNQARQLLNELPQMARTMVCLSILTGMRRGELFALQWKHFEEKAETLAINRAIYDGKIDSPKTQKSVRRLPLSAATLELVFAWKRVAKKTTLEDLIFCTRSGKPVSPNNVLRRYVYPACAKLGLRNASWLTFRRTFASWSHDDGVRDKVVAELMGHSNVYTTLNIYPQVMPDSLRTAVSKVGNKLFAVGGRPCLVL